MFAILPGTDQKIVGLVDGQIKRYNYKEKQILYIKMA